MDKQDRSYIWTRRIVALGCVWIIFAFGVLGYAARANAQNVHLPPSQKFSEWTSKRIFGKNSTVLVDVYSGDLEVPRVGGHGCVGWFIGYGTILRASVCGHLRITYRSQSIVRIYVREFPNGV